jgi:hypothetical protein
MADWTLPIETTQYLQVLANLKDRDIDAATWGGYVNPPVNALRFDRASGHPYTMQEWDGTAWHNKILSVTSGGTGSMNLDDFKASLGLGSMAYQNASSVAITGGNLSNVGITGGSPINTTIAPVFAAGLIAMADANGAAIKVLGRAADNYMSIQFQTRDQATNLGMLYVNSAIHLYTNMHLIPTVSGANNLGHNDNRWANIFGWSFQASSGQGGYLFDTSPIFGLYYSQTYATLSINTGTGGFPAIGISYSSNIVWFGGHVYPYVTRAQYLGTTTQFWGSVHSVWHKASADGGFILGEETGTGLYFHSSAYPAIKHGGAALQYWAIDHTAITCTIYVQQKASNVGTIINQSTVSNYISFHSGGFSFWTQGVNIINLTSGELHIAGAPRLVLSPASGSDAYLKFVWYGEADKGFWLEGAGVNAVWHFNMANNKLFNLHATSGLGLPAVSMYHTVPTSDMALWMGYPGVPYRWYSMAMWVAASVGSDKRDKDILGEEKLGLDFINRLDPIMYKMPNLKWKDDNKKTWHGLAAQDVEKVLNKLGIDFAGLINIDDSYSLRYTEFIGPIIKAIQELDRKVEDAKAEFLSRK